jgi:hypothetical protein
MCDADTLAEQLGVDGTRPELVAVSAMVTSAYATRDMETVQMAVTEFTILARRLRSAGAWRVVRG